MGVEAVIATQVIDTTSVGRSLMTAVDAAAARTALSLGTLATQDGTFSGTSSGTNTGDQSLFSTIAVSGQSNVVADATSDTLTLVAGTNITITTDASTDTITITAASGGVTGTGSVDNAALRADGTGGVTLQNSAWLIADNATASPNNTVNHASLQATGGTTNVSVSIVAKGTGAFCLQVPDGTTAGGNARGANAVDLQSARSANTQVASGTVAFAAGGYNTCVGLEAPITIGMFCTTGGYTPIALGYNCTVSGAFGQGNIAMGKGATANYGAEPQATAIGTNVSATSAAAWATGSRSVADRMSMKAHANGMFAAAGDAQRVSFVARNKTTNNTATTLFLDGSSTRLTIPSGKVASLMCRICGIKSDGSAVADYVRRVVIKNVGGTTSLVGSVETIGTDIEDNASTDVAITADNTNDALDISVTGITAETWRWVAVVEGLEIAYGT